MDRTTATNYTTDSNGHRVFQDRNLSTGTSGTTQSAVDHTAYQEEILGVIEGGGITPDAGDNKQMLAALKVLFGLTVITPKVSQTITPGLTQTIVIPSLAADATLTLAPGTTYGQRVRVYGAAGHAVTVASSVSSGSPLFAWPDDTGSYAYVLPSVREAYLDLVWDQSDWRVHAVNDVSSFRHMALFTASTTWTVPAGVTRIRLRGVGGGGGSAAFVGGNADMPGCGGGAGYFEGIYAVTPGTTYTVTIGAAGIGGTTGAGGTGGTTSFGSLATALGGAGGANGSNPAGGIGGAASGGQINIQGGDGTDGLFINGYTSATNLQGGPGLGGSTPLGGGGRSGVSNAIPGHGYGSGAGAPYCAGSTTVAGATGAPGAIILEY